jgi:drug/metabolite transporter (DMT)-like permease
VSTLGLVALALASLCYGVASVLQTLGSRSVLHTKRIDPRLFGRLIGQAPYVLGLVLSGLGFALQLPALRAFPLFLVQAAQSANLIVTTIVAIPILGIRPRGYEWCAVGSICGGLALLGFSAGERHSNGAGLGFRLGLIGCVALVALTGFAASSLRKPFAAPTLGILAGTGFGLVAVAIRSIANPSPSGLLTDPAAYVVVVAGGLAFLLYASGLRNGEVTTTTAALIVAQTAMPAAVGVLIFGDQAKRGYEGVAIAGFLVAVIGASALALLRPGSAEEQRR